MMARFAKTRGRGSPLPLKLEHTRWRAGMEMPWLSAPAIHARRVDSLYSARPAITKLCVPKTEVATVVCGRRSPP